MENQKHHLHTFSAKIEGKFTRGHIFVEKNEIFLCQNIRNGKSSPNKLGYKYSYTITEGTEDDLKRNEVSDFKIYKKKLSNNFIADYNEKLRIEEERREKEHQEREKNREEIQEIYFQGPEYILKLVRRIEALEKEIESLKSEK